MQTQSESVAFQAEISQLMNMMINSIYSQKEIFLRELISNASDACDKLKFLSLTDDTLKSLHPEFRISIKPNKELKTLEIRDNGIGMTLDEVKANIGTIAKSGTKEFLEKAKQSPGAAQDLIGQFGVGFYSAFMVASRVILHTQKAGESEGTIWESDGLGAYKLSRAPRPEGFGTTVTLVLKGKEDDDDAFQDFTEEWELRRLIKKYSDFISHPVALTVKKNDEEGFTEEIINSGKAIWTRSPSDVTEEELKDFYQHVSKDWTAPFKSIFYKAEGKFEFQSLMFVPQKRQPQFLNPEKNWGLNLYVKKVFIMDNCEGLLPPYLRFVSGVVDSSDLSLNVSREILQQDRQVLSINKSLTSKVLKELKNALEQDREKYIEFFKEFGAVLKESATYEFGRDLDKVKDLFVFHSTKVDKPTTLSEYVERMKPDQTDIYFLTGDDLEKMKNSPHIEALKEKEYEVLLLNDPIDEWLTQTLTTYNDKKLINAARESTEAEASAEKTAETDPAQEEQTAAWKPVLEEFKTKLSPWGVKEVKLSKRLKTSPAVLVDDAMGPSTQMKKILQSFGRSESEMPPSARTLELNPTHPVVLKLKEFDTGSTDKELWMEMLYNQALLLEGSELPNPQKFSADLASLMLRAKS